MRNRILETALMVATTPLDKGRHGGSCFRASCNSVGADWWNPHMGYYYCASCARSINESLAAQNLKLCERHALGEGHDA